MIFQDTPVSQEQGRLTTFMYKVYGWMTLGLVLTSLTAWFTASTPALYTFLFNNSIALIGIIIAQFALVMVLSLLINRMSFLTATVAFIAYSLLLGCTLASVLLLYTPASVGITFAVTAGMFGAMALYGYFTRADLTSMGNFCMMGLIGLIIAMLVNVFIKSEKFDLILSAFGVIIFTLLTAYDVQKIKAIAQTIGNEKEMRNKGALMGALILYLDFINLFLLMLRFTGRQRN
jgi:FtsH-binding integral membrane protein